MVRAHEVALRELGASAFQSRFELPGRGFHGRSSQPGEMVRTLGIAAALEKRSCGPSSLAQYPAFRARWAAGLPGRRPRIACGLWASADTATSAPPSPHAGTNGPTGELAVAWITRLPVSQMDRPSAHPPKSALSPWNSDASAGSRRIVRHQFELFNCRRPASGGAGRRSSEAHVTPVHPGSQSQVLEAVQIPRRPQSSSVAQAPEKEIARETAAATLSEDACLGMAATLL
jgi:hypothetical protein